MGAGIDVEGARRALSEEYWAENKESIAQAWLEATENAPADQKLYFYNKKDNIGKDTAYRLGQFAEMREMYVSPEFLKVFDAMVAKEMIKAKTLDDVRDVLYEKIKDYAVPGSIQEKNQKDFLRPLQHSQKDGASVITSDAQAIFVARIEQNVAAHYDKLQAEATQQNSIQQS